MTDATGSIVTDELDDATGDDADGINAFLSNLTGEPKKRSTETDEEAPETAETETAAATEEKTTEEPSGEPAEADPDDAEVEIKVGEETKTAKLRDLKRLYGQEASLTQKSQAVAQLRQATEAHHQRAETALKGLIGRADEKLAQFKDIDWFVLSQQMDPTSLKLLRDEFTAAQNDRAFYETELTQTMQAAQERAMTEHRQAAEECRKVLEDPKTGIEGFGPQLYNDIAAFAEQHGMNAFRTITAPGAIKLMHMAMLYARGQTAAQQAAAKVQKAVQKPSTVLKPGSGKPTQKGGRADVLARLARTGSDDDAEAAFMANLFGEK